MTARFEGNGASSGDSIILTVTRLPAAPAGALKVYVPAGTMLHSRSAGYQNMVVAAIRGRMVSETSFIPSADIELSDNRPTAYLVSAYCANVDLENPTSATGFSLSEPDPLLACLAERGRSLSIAALQAAVWIHTDRMSYARMQSKFNIGAREWSEAETLHRTCLEPPPDRGALSRALLLAAYHGDLGQIAPLIAQGADVNFQEEELGVTPLLAASHKGHPEVVRALLDAGASLRSQSKKGLAALEYSLRGRHLLVSSILLARGFPAKERTRQGATYLELAIKNESAEQVKLLLDHGADPNQRNCDGMMPLLFTVTFDQPRIAEMLLDRGANVNAREVVLEVTPLLAAAMLNKPALVDLFLSAGADLRAKAEGLTALARARQQGFTAIADTLRRAAAQKSPTPAKASGSPPLLLPWRSELEGCREINAASPDPQKTAQLNLALVRESARGDVTALMDLIAMGADVNTQTDSGISPLVAAAGMGHAMVVRVLAKNGADVNAKTRDGFSPITLASLRGYKAVVRELIAAGARTTPAPAR